MARRAAGPQRTQRLLTPRTCRRLNFNLEERLPFPYEAECIKARKMSPLKPGERVTVLRMLHDDTNDLSDMIVDVEWRDRTMGITLAQIKGSDVDEEAAEAI